MDGEAPSRSLDDLAETTRKKAAAKPTTTDGLGLVVDYIERQGGVIPDGLTAKKIRERATVVDDPGRPDCVVFEVERHRGILGAQYRPGLPMSSYETYWPRYAFCPSTEDLNEIGEVREPETHVDCEALAAEQTESDFLSLSFEKQGGKHLVSEAVFAKEDRLVANKDEAIEYVLEVALERILWYLKEQLEGHDLDPSTYLAPLRTALEAAIRERVEAAWSDYQKHET